MVSVKLSPYLCIKTYHFSKEMVIETPSVVHHTDKLSLIIFSNIHQLLLQSMCNRGYRLNNFFLVFFVKKKVCTSEMTTAAQIKRKLVFCCKGELPLSGETQVYKIFDAKYDCGTKNG